MSLLMDALKKAERAKRQGLASEGSPKEPEARGGLALEPLADAGRLEPSLTPAGGRGTPASQGQLTNASHLEELDAQFLAEAKQAAASRVKAQTTASAREAPPVPAALEPPGAGQPVKPRPGKARPADPEIKSAAQNLFAAKQPETPPSRKRFAVTVGSVTALAVCGIGGYFWWQLQPKSSLVASHIPAPSTPPAPAAAPAAPITVAPPAAVPPAPTPMATAGVRPLTSQPVSPRPAATANEEEDEKPEVAAGKATTPSRRTEPLPASPARPDSPIRVTRTALRVNPDLMRGFDAFSRGDLTAAHTDYERALRADPRNTDALHGLAAVAVRQGSLDQAEHLYRKIAEADPHDSTAASALINLRRQTDPSNAESRLKTLAADQPELAAPHFSLGNLYAGQQRWNDAQQAYFRAYNADPENPDIMFNLAVSLEHMRQNKLAAQYYGQAIAAAKTRTAGFDQAQAAARLRALQP